MIDITSNAGWLASTLRIINLMQMMVQGRWINEPDLLNIPKVTSASLPSFLREIQTQFKDTTIDCLAKLRFAAIRDEQHLHKALINVYGTQAADGMKKFVRNLPWVDVTFTIQAVDDDSSAAQKDDIILAPGTEYNVQVDFYRKGDVSLEVQSKKFPKRKDEGWFLCVGLKEELCGIKRVNIKRKGSSSVRLRTPNYQGNFVYTLFLISDSYLGLDQQYDIPVQIKTSQ